jgi:hypothetical protein
MDNIKVSRDTIEACSDPAFLSMCITLCEGVDDIDNFAYGITRKRCLRRLQALEAGGTSDDALERKCRAFLTTINTDNYYDSMDAINAVSDPAYLNMCISVCDKLDSGNGFYENIKNDIIRRLNYLDSSTRAPTRIVDADFEIIKTGLMHTYDLDALQEKVKSLFKWHNDPKERKTYIAPYFPLVQSSGMGKTKLLYELRNLLLQSGEYSCEMILCRDGEIQLNSGDNVFSQSIDFNQKMKDGDPRLKRYELVGKALDEIVESCVASKVVLLFDEAQHLLADSGFFFRCIRWWLRKKSQKKQIAAIFTGTNAKLVNFYEEPRESKISRDTSVGLYHEDGARMYDAFYRLHTIGCKRYPFRSDASEYDNSVQFGRPLFSVLHAKGKLDPVAHQRILERMLFLQDTDPSEEWSIEACMNVISTRVQMGRTTFAVASNLLAKAYANLINLSVGTEIGEGEVAELAYLPDPVCARLAMCVMDETWHSGQKNKSRSGKEKSFWISKMIETFSTGLCQPSRGDVGELAVAMYLLFCGDELRRRLPQGLIGYETFSVSLAHWLKLLTTRREEFEASVDKFGVAAASAPKSSTSTISFIQVCRNYLRFPVGTLIQDQSFLQYLYMSRCALYTYPKCPGVDILASIRIESKGKKDQYRPLLISVKTENVFGPKDQNDEIDIMKTLLKTNGVGGVCLLVMLDRGGKGKVTPEIDLTPILTGTVSMAIDIPREDFYGLTRAVREMTTAKAETAEIFASHFVLPYCPEATTTKQKNTPEGSQGLRSERPKTLKKDPVLTNYKKLRTELKKILPLSPAVAESGDSLADG